MPGEFAFLPWVESSYNMLPARGDGVAGMWQLMPFTARENGLRVDGDYDGRLDVTASSRTALGLLKQYKESFGDWRLANPISEEMKVMRPSLLPGLIAAARRNLDRGASSVRLFEVGRRYLGDAEHPTLGLLLAGERRTREWQSGKAQSFDTFDVKVEVSALLEAAGAPIANLQVYPDAGPTWHPGRSRPGTGGTKG